jgi:hypothetical protein
LDDLIADTTRGLVGELVSIGNPAACVFRGIVTGDFAEA